MCLLYSNSDLRFKDFIQYPEVKIPKNSLTFITGKSGCGKSSYLKMLNRMILPESGAILFCGKEIGTYPVLDYRKEVLLVPQEIFLLDGTIRENFDFYYNARGTTPLSDQKIKQFLRICCMEFSPTDFCTKMSGGERQRVFLAIFLSMASNVLLLDEPTAALDDKTSNELLQNLQQYCNQASITVVCVSHNSHLVELFADNVICLEGHRHESS